jgi:hypothetical protein
MARLYCAIRVSNRFLTSLVTSAALRSTASFFGAGLTTSMNLKIARSDTSSLKADVMLFLEHSKVTVADLVQVEWLIPAQFACAVQIVLAAHHFIGAVQTCHCFFLVSFCREGLVVLQLLHCEVDVILWHFAF